MNTLVCRKRYFVYKNFRFVEEGVALKLYKIKLESWLGREDVK